MHRSSVTMIPRFTRRGSFFDVKRRRINTNIVHTAASVAVVARSNGFPSRKDKQESGKSNHNQHRNNNSDRNSGGRHQKLGLDTFIYNDSSQLSHGYSQHVLTSPQQPQQPQQPQLLLTKKLPSSSPNPSETTLDDPSPPKPKSPAHFKLDPRAIFPWRHSPHPLPRLVPNTEEHISQGGYLGPGFPPLNTFFRTFNWVMAASSLGANVWSYWGWKEELEGGFQVAFAVAVQCLMADVYRINEINANETASTSSNSTTNEGNDSDYNDSDNQDSGSDEEKVDVDNDNTNDAGSDDGGGNGNDIPSIHFDHDIDPLPKDELPSDLNHDKTIQSNTRNMLEQNLISLYKSAHEHMKHKLRINLQSTPTSATIMNLMLIPFLTREEVRQKPALRHAFRDIEKGLRQIEVERGSKLSIFEVWDHLAQGLDQLAHKQMRRQIDKNMQGNMLVTVIAQVAINCNELFQVVDIETGECLQGDPDGQMKEVTHLVRFEIVVDSDGNIGTWQITDWDDLLDGNMCFF